eukprot:PITA_12912
MCLAFKAFVEKQSRHQILKLRSDNGGEYVNHKFINFCNENGIQMQQPTSFIQTDSSLLCQFKKSIYGFNAEASPLLVSFIDSDWVGDPNDRKSTVGYLFTLGSRPITWACKKQSAISLSSTEVEYHGAIESSKEALWLRQILSGFGFQQQHPTTLWCDNQSAIQLCKDPVQHQRNKHIELHMHFVRKIIHDHVLEVQYFSIDDQVANIFTKALTKVKFTKLRFMVGF